MECPKRFQRNLGGPFHRTLITDVDDHRHHGIANPFGLRCERRLVDVSHHHSHAFSDEGFDKRQADAAGRPGDDANPITKDLHVPIVTRRGTSRDGRHPTTVMLLDRGWRLPAGSIEVLRSL